MGTRGGAGGIVVKTGLVWRWAFHDIGFPSRDSANPYPNRLGELPINC